MKAGVLALLAGAAAARTGIDVSQLFPSSSWSCVRDYGYTFAIIRCYCSTGEIDGNCAQSVKNAWAGGMESVDLYMFPCPTCGNAAGQVQALKNHVDSVGINFGQLWLDIEAASLWLGDYGSNRAFMNDLANAASSVFGSKLGGIYTNANGWSSIMGDWSEWGNLRLWWAYWDSNPSFSGWSAFAGWSNPTIKQYVGDDSFCGVTLDKNYY